RRPGGPAGHRLGHRDPRGPARRHGRAARSGAAGARRRARRSRPGPARPVARCARRPSSHRRDAAPASGPAGTMGGLPGRRSPGDDPRRTLMIVTLTPNPAVDVTYTVPRLSPGEVHRVQQVVESAGGKGVNVARVLAQLGRRVSCTGFLGGTAGETLEDLLIPAPVEQSWILVSGQTRRTVTVVDASGATVLN